MKTKNRAKTTSPSSEKTSPTSTPPSHVHKMLIDADNLSVNLGGELVLDGISLCVHTGEFIGIVGTNGAGKTTLLRTILGFIKPATGHIHKNDASIGYIPQNGNNYSGNVPISVLEVVKLGAAGSSSLAQSALETVGLKELANRRFTDLSGGQKQRVTIAKALASQPDVLILDEPTTGIDEKSQADFYRILHDLQHRGITIITVGHEVETLVNHASRIICINRSIQYDGTPEAFDPAKHLPSFYKTQHQLLHHQEHTHGESHV